MEKYADKVQKVITFISIIKWNYATKCYNTKMDESSSRKVGTYQT